MLCLHNTGLNVQAVRVDQEDKEFSFTKYLIVFPAPSQNNNNVIMLMKP